MLFIFSIPPSLMGYTFTYFCLFLSKYPEDLYKSILRRCRNVDFYDNDFEIGNTYYYHYGEKYILSRQLRYKEKTLLLIGASFVKGRGMDTFYRIMHYFDERDGNLLLETHGVFDCESEECDKKNLLVMRSRDKPLESPYFIIYDEAMNHDTPEWLRDKGFVLPPIEVDKDLVDENVVYCNFDLLIEKINML